MGSIPGLGPLPPTPPRKPLWGRLAFLFAVGGMVGLVALSEYGTRPSSSTPPTTLRAARVVQPAPQPPDRRPAPSASPSTSCVKKSAGKTDIDRLAAWLICGGYESGPGILQYVDGIAVNDSIAT